MSDVIDLGHDLWRYSHIFAAFIGLATFWIPIFAVKGGRLHIFTGRIFTWCAGYVGLTGLFSSLWAIADPIGFSGSELAGVSPGALPYVIEKSRFFFAILGFLSMAILCGVVLGVRVVRTRRDHQLLRSRPLVALEIGMALFSLALAAFGAWNLYLAYTGQHLLPSKACGKYWVHIALGAVGMLSAVEDLKYLFRPRPTPMAWWYKHMENMLGCGIGFHTAFLVFGMNRLVDLNLPGPLQILPWILPAAVGLPAMSVWIHHYKRKFGELPSQRTEQSASPTQLTCVDTSTRA